MERFCALFCIRNITIALAVYGTAGVALAQSTVEALKDFSPPREWSPPESKSYLDDWNKKISSRLNSPEWVKAHCASKHSDRTSEETKASFAGVHHDRISLRNICFSELSDPDLKKKILSSFNEKHGDEMLHAYLTPTSDGSVELHYLTPRFDCLDRGMGESEKTKTKTHLSFGAGISSELAPKKTNVGCNVNQPLGEKSALRVFLNTWKEQINVPGKYVQEGSYLATPDFGVWVSQAEEESRNKTKVVLDKIEEKIKKQRAEIELELKEKPLFTVPDGPDEDNYAYIIDRTGSYQGSFDKVIDELVETVKNYPENKHLSISFFGTKRGQGANNQAENFIEDGKLVLATTQNKQKIITELLKKREEAIKYNSASIKNKSDIIMNEYATSVMSQVSERNNGKKINYKYFGDGKISIGQDSETNSASKSERENQIGFMKKATQSGSFEFIPLNDQFSPEFKSAAEKFARFVDPNQKRKSASEYYSKQKSLVAKKEKLEADWAVIKKIKLPYDPNSSLFQLYDQFNKTRKASVEAQSKDKGEYNLFLKTKGDFQQALNITNVAHEQLPALIKTYGADGTIDLPTVLESQKFKTNYHIGYNDDLLKREKACK